jgi:membrane protein implicated in regulation of membrane protease activity
MLKRVTWDELGIVVALAIAGVLFLTGAKALLGALLCVAAVVFAIALWTPVRERLHIPPSPRRGLWRPARPPRDHDRNGRPRA